MPRLLPPVPHPISTGSNTEVVDACHLHALLNSTNSSWAHFWGSLSLLL